MKTRSGIFLLALILSFRTDTTQAADPVVRCRQVFSVSSEQWMCLELKQNDPDFFSCRSLSPSSSAARLSFDPGIVPKADENSKIQALFENGDDCGTYLNLRALSDLYFPLFEKKLKSKNLPEHYKYLPLVLSGLNQHHVSADGRSGLWSMDFLAARAVKLRIDSLCDERKGGDFTTDAAVAYLSYLYESYEGDEAAVLMAYVYGNGYMRKLIHNSEDKKWRNCLPTEQRLFLLMYAFVVNKFESDSSDNKMSAYFDILGQYQNMGFEKNVRYEALSKVLGLDTKVLKSRNPVYTGDWISPVARRVPFVLDAQNAARFEHLSDSIYNWQPPAPVVSELPKQLSTFHKVKRGETLGGIASKYHISISQLKKWNKLKGNTIYPGQRLKVRSGNQTKVASETDKQSSEAPSLKSTEERADEKQKSVPTSSGNQKAHASGQTKIVTYTVRSGDTLWQIAARYNGVTPEEIMKWNSCSEKIRPGQKLKIHLD